MVRLYRTFTNYIMTVEARCAGCLCTSSGWFQHVEPPRTFSNHIIAEMARCVEFFHISSGWFDSTERCLCTSSGWFKHVEPPRTFSNNIIAEMARCVEFFHMTSGWFDSTELSLTTYLDGKQGVQGAIALVRGCSSPSNLLEPSRTTSVQRWQGVTSFFT